MAYLGSSWVKLGCAGQDGVIYGEWWVSTVVDGVINDVAGVQDTGGSEMALFLAFWGNLGGWGTFQGCSGGCQETSTVTYQIA